MILLTLIHEGYALLVILYGWLAYSSDYRKYSDLARRRAEVS